MEQPKFKFGEKVQWELTPSINFIITKIEKSSSAYSYKSHDSLAWYHEHGLRIARPDPSPITGLDFNRVWQAHYGCTWDNQKSHDLYVNLKNYLELKGLVI